MSKNPPFTSGQAAEYCHVSQATIVNWIKEGKLGGYTTPGGHYRIPRSDLVSFLKTHDMPIDSALRQPLQTSVLVLSDNPTIRELVQGLAEKRGFSVHLVASDYATSAEAVRSTPDAVVIDAEASSDPLGLCRWLRNAAESATVLMLGDGHDLTTEGAEGVDFKISGDDLSSLEDKLEVLLS